MYDYPRVFAKKKRGLCVTGRRPSVCLSCPSGRPSVSQQFTSNSSYTIDARITKLICMILLCIQMVATYLELFYIFQFWKVQILVILPKNAISLGIYHEISSNFLSVWGNVIYIIYQTGFIMWLSDHPHKWKYRWRGRILKENCLLLQFTSTFSCTIDARITKLICMIPQCIQMVATYLKFFYDFQFWNNSDFILLWFYTKIHLGFKESKFSFFSALEVH